jgi:hypothetical protein
VTGYSSLVPFCMMGVPFIGDIAILVRLRSSPWALIGADWLQLYEYNQSHKSNISTFLRPSTDQQPRAGPGLDLIFTCTSTIL